VTDDHFSEPCDDNAYTFVSSQPKYTVPSEPIDADEYMLLPPVVWYFHFKLPSVDDNAYMWESLAPTYTLPSDPMATEANTLPPVA